MDTTSTLCVQIGLAASIGLIDRVGPEGVAWLRLVWASAIFAALGRPWQLRLTRLLRLTRVRGVAVLPQR